MQLSKYLAAQEGCIFYGNMYNELRKVMGVVIFLNVASYFESCMIYLTKLNDILKVA